VRALRCELQVLRAELRTSASQREEVEAEADDMRIVLEREARLQEDNRCGAERERERERAWWAHTRGGKALAFKQPPMRPGDAAPCFLMPAVVRPLIRFMRMRRLLLVEREQWETALREATIDAERAKQALADRKARAEEVVESQVRLRRRTRATALSVRSSSPL
jgi:hypothetical protein